ncbi:hypothetical protein LINPERHAP2_LOCUS27953 [Linum perenne]
MPSCPVKSSRSGRGREELRSGILDLGTLLQGSTRKQTIIVRSWRDRGW